MQSHLFPELIPGSSYKGGKKETELRVTQEAGTAGQSWVSVLLETLGHTGWNRAQRQEEAAVFTHHFLPALAES